jgi:hypothetical protein
MTAKAKTSATVGRLPFRDARGLLCAGLTLLLLGLSGPAAAAFESAVQPGDLDLANCAAWRDGQPEKADPKTLKHVLGIERQRDNLQWAGPGGHVKEGEPTYHFRLAFSQPLSIGTVLIDGGRVRFLKADAAYPGDPAKEEQWEEPQAWPNQSGMTSFILPPGTKVRALLCTKPMPWTRSPASAGTWRLFKERLLNVCPIAFANASEEYTPPAAAGGPRTPPMKIDRIVTGRGVHWQNTGADIEGKVRRAAIDKTSPVRVVLSWRKPQKLVGLLPFGECGGFELGYFDGPPDVPPTAGTRREWRRLPFEATPDGILAFDPVETRGIEVLITQGGREPAIASLSGMHVYLDLGEQPVPDFPHARTALAPVQIRYEMPHGGLAAMVIEDALGSRVRNLFAMQERSAGPNEAGWDAKDMDGKFVAPGAYTWRAITSKPIELHYQFTFYPNISNNTPWQIGPTEAGGWIADHAPPTAVCAWGDRVWMGSPCSESGVSFIETDLTGKKLAGWSAFGPFVGARYLATDGRTVFISSPQENLDSVWAYDPVKRDVRTVLEQRPTESRRTGLVGLAARDGKVVMAIRSKSTWLAGPFGDASVDLDASWPRHRPARKPIKANEIVPKPQEDFLRLFRLKGVPPGMGSIGLTWLETENEAGRRHHVVLAFHQPQTIGSAVFPVPPAGEDMKFYLSILKPDAKYPPDPNDKAQWTVLEDSGRLGAWDCVPFPADTKTRALRITWEKKGDDPLTDVEEGFGESGKGDGLGLQVLGIDERKASGAQWQGRLEGMRFLRRRYRNLCREAKIRVSSGEINEAGEWDARRKTPLTEADPGIYVMEWPKRETVRGVAIKEVDGRLTYLDVYTGPDDQPIDIRSDEGWEKVGEYLQERRDHHSGFESCNVGALYMDDVVDFGREVATRAIRVRIVDQWHDHGPRSDFGVRPDRGGKTLDATRCRVYGIAALSYLGGEEAVDPRQTERIAVYDVAQGKYVNETALDRPGDVAYHPDGALYAISGEKVVKVDLDAGTDSAAHKAVIQDLKSPVCLTLDKQGRIYVFDGSPDRQNVRIYGPDGKHLKSLGREGGRKAGLWDVETFAAVTGMATDSEGGLWVVECNYWPKRISKWSADGKFVSEHLGPTQYGGAGVLDPYDKRRAYYGPVEFELDWEKGTSRVRALTWTGPTEAGDVPIVFKGRKYMVTRGDFGRQGAAHVYLYEEDHLKLVGGLGRADALPQLKEPKMLAALGNVSLPDKRFLFTDLNGDGEVQAEEVQIRPAAAEHFGLFNQFLSINAGSLHFRVKEVLANGAPVWDEIDYPKVTVLHEFQSTCQPLADGNFFISGFWNGVVTPEGKVLWKYRTEGRGVQALHQAPPYAPGQVAGEFGTISHPDSMQAPREGELGAFEVHHSNPGAWNIWTHDGFLAGHLFRDQRHPGTPAWQMKEHQRGLRLDNHTPGQEHFNGYLCRADDGKYYVVAGHNHASIVEVRGLDTFRRLTGKLTLSAEDLERIKQWEIDHQQAEVYARSPVYDLYKFRTAPKIDGDDRDWTGLPEAAIESGALDEAPPAHFKMGYDDRNLYLYYAVRRGPLKNAGGDWRTLFKTGASVDLQMGVNPEAPGDRQAPAEGDLRLLIAYVREKPVAVLYRPVVPGTPPGKVFQVVSPVNKVDIDEVRQVENAEVARGDGHGYVLEAAVPLEALGFRPKLGQRYRFDWGILTTDTYGNSCTGRLYWSNKATGILADTPSEARILPHLWGFLRVHQHPKSGPDDLHSLSSLNERETDATDSIDVEKEFEEKEQRGKD